MKVAVFGGAGYVGSALVPELLNRGHDVAVYDTLFFGPDGLADVHDRIGIHNLDVRSVTAADLTGSDAVINLAGISSDPIAEFRPALTWEMNVTGAARLAEMSKRAGVRRYLFASSCSVYDRNDASNEGDALQDESAALSPVSTYARSKLEAERIVLSFSSRTFCPVALRKGTVFGFSPRMRYDLVINTLLKDALSKARMTLKAGGEAWRPVVEIGDAAKAYVACLDAAPASIAGQAFNVVLGNFRVSEMALRIREAVRSIGLDTDIRADYADRPDRSYRASGRRMEESLGFRPMTGIEESVRGTVTRLRQDRFTDFEHPRFHNIQSLEALDAMNADR